MRIVLAAALLAALAGCSEAPSQTAEPASSVMPRGPYNAASASAQQLTGNMRIERAGMLFDSGITLFTRTLDPLRGTGVADIGAEALLERAGDGLVQEVILATNFTAEGEVTAQALQAALLARGLKVTRLARGVPAGSELEYVDLSTIAHAMGERR